MRLILLAVAVTACLSQIADGQVYYRYPSVYSSCASGTCGQSAVYVESAPAVYYAAPVYRHSASVHVVNPVYVRRGLFWRRNTLWLGY